MNKAQHLHPAGFYLSKPRSSSSPPASWPRWRIPAFQKVRTNQQDKAVPLNNACQRRPALTSTTSRTASRPLSSPTCSGRHHTSRRFNSVANETYPTTFTQGAIVTIASVAAGTRNDRTMPTTRSTSRLCAKHSKSAYKFSALMSGLCNPLSTIILIETIGGKLTPSFTAAGFLVVSAGSGNCFLVVAEDNSSSVIVSR